MAKDKETDLKEVVLEWDHEERAGRWELLEERSTQQ